MLCETIMQTPSSGRYAQHKHVDAAMKARFVDVTRTFTWMAMSSTSIKVRCDTDEDDQWCPVTIPATGAIIRFTLDAHVRRWTRGPKRQRVSNTSYVDNLDWLERLSGRIGIALRGMDYDPITIPIEKPARPFLMTASRFRGIGTVVEPQLLAVALERGIANAKAFGCGFFNFTMLDG